MDHNEKIVVRQLKEGSEKAYKYIYDTYYTTLCHTANKYLKDHDQAEQIVGDTIFHLWEIRETLEVEISLLMYLMTAVRNRCFNYLSLARTRYEIPVSSLVRSENVSDADVFTHATPKDYALRQLVEKELDAELKHAINALPPECKLVFIKSRFEKKRYEDISQELSISVNTVKYHMKNALRFLRERLEKHIAIVVILFTKIFF